MLYLRNSAIYFAVLPGLTLLSAAGVYCSLETAIATYDSLASTLSQRSAAATALPRSADYQVRLADLRRAAGLPFTANLKAAVKNSPADSGLWILLGLAQEQDGDPKNAEVSLLRAGTLGKDYDTRWTLANFYFRRGDRTQAVAWACAVLSIPGVEAGPVFTLLANFPAQPDCLLASDFSGPESARLGYLQWLISKGSLDAATPIADLLIRRRDTESVPALLDYCDLLLLAGNGQSAARLWNSMASQHLVSASVTTDALTDGVLNLTNPPHGFAWRTSPVVPGTDVTPLHPGVQILLSGTQPDRCDLLSQWVLLGSNAAHALRYDYQSSGMESGAGLHWKIAALLGGNWRDISLEDPDRGLHDGGGPEASVRFETPPGALVRVALTYERAPGTAPASGWLRLEKVWLTE